MADTGAGGASLAGTGAWGARLADTGAEGCRLAGTGAGGARLAGTGGRISLPLAVGWAGVLRGLGAVFISFALSWCDRHVHGSVCTD